MKKLIFFFLGVLSLTTSYAQSVGNFQQLATIKRGDTLDVIFSYVPDTSKDVRTFQIDFQYRKQLFTHVSTTADDTLNNMTPTISFKKYDNYKFSGYNSGNGTYSYSADTNYTVGRNYLVLSTGTEIQNSIYIIHNKFLINDVPSNFDADSVEVNWARLFKVDGTTIGDNVATLSVQKMHLELEGNLVISGKVWLPNTMKADGRRPTIIATKHTTGTFVSSSPVDTAGNYSLNNVDKNTKYKLYVRFDSDSLETFRDLAVTISDAVKTYDEFSNADINQSYPHTYLKNGLAFLIADINKTGTLDGGDPYRIYSSVSGLNKIDTTILVNAFHKSTYDSLALGVNQWTTWANYINATNYVVDSVGTTNLVVDIKYFMLGDADRTHSSPVYDANGNLVQAAIFRGDLDIEIPNTFSSGNNPIYIPFNINTNGDENYGLQFEMKYDNSKVKFEEIVANFNGGPWLQYVTHDETEGTIRFGGMNNQPQKGLIGTATPFKIRFSPIGFNDIQTNVYVRNLMDASDMNGDHLNIDFVSAVTTISYKSEPIPGDELAEEILVSIRPNPTGGWFEIEVNFPQPDMSLNVNIYDKNGRYVKNEGVISTDGYLKKVYKQINMSTYPNGNYLLVLNNYNKQVTKQFIKL